MAIYIYKISTSYHNNKEWVAGFIENHKNNHQDGNWYFIHQKEEFSLYKLPDGEIYTYTDDDFKYSYDEEEEGYGTTLVQTRDSEINNYMIDFESNYLTHLSEMDRFQLQAIYPFGDSSGNEFFAMDVYSENTYDEGFYGSGFQDHSWTNKEGGLDDYFEGDIKISDVVSKIMDKCK